MKANQTMCSFCNKPAGNKYGLDLLGRVYCRRLTCKFKKWIKDKIINRYLRLKKSW